MDESQQVPQQPVHQPSEAFDFSTFSAWMHQQDQRAIRQKQRDNFIMDQNAALFRSQRGMHQTYYDARLHPLDPSYMMTPAIFMEYCGWPGDRPTFIGGGEHSGVADDDEERTASADGDDVMDDDA